MASCSGCGTEVTTDAAFCTKCGQQVPTGGSTKPKGIWHTLNGTDSAIPGRVLAIMIGTYGLWTGGAFLLCLPIGLVTLGNGLLVKKGPPALRLACILVGLLNLAMPFLGNPFL